MKIEEIQKYARLLSGNDFDFFNRVWNTPENIYLNRLKAIGFLNKAKVLDAGFGFGQWLIPISKLNIETVGIEYSYIRYETMVKIVKDQNIQNIELLHGSIENIKLNDNEFDAVFCYSVIQHTDYRKSLAEFYRLLKPGGLLYFNSNGFGWYLHNLIEGHNSTSNFFSKQMAIDAIENSINYYSVGVHKLGTSIITPFAVLISTLEGLGFKKIIYGSEGTLNKNPSVEIKSFFKGKYLNHEGVIEFLCEK